MMRGVLAEVMRPKLPALWRIFRMAFLNN